MKRIAATIISIALIVAYTVFAYIYTGNFADEMISEINYAEKEFFNDRSIEEIKNSFEDNKKILLIISNKDHIDELENAITDFEYAVIHKNAQDTQTCAKQIINIVNGIKRASHTLY